MPWEKGLITRPGLEDEKISAGWAAGAAGMDFTLILIISAFIHQPGRNFPPGLSIYITSSKYEGKGVSQNMRIYDDYYVLRKEL